MKEEESTFSFISCVEESMVPVIKSHLQDEATNKMVVTVAEDVKCFEPTLNKNENHFEKNKTERSLRKIL